MFPDMATIWQHREVVKFACCLSDQPDVLIEIVCDRLVTQATVYSKNVYSGKEMFHADYNFLKELATEIPNENFTVDPLRNKFVNYFDEEEEDEQWIIVPSKIFIGLGEDQQSALLFSDSKSETSAAEAASEKKTSEHDHQLQTKPSDSEDDVEDGRHHEKLPDRKTEDSTVVEGRLMHTFHKRSQRYGMDAALHMLQEIREYVPVRVTKIDMPCLQLTEDSVTGDERYFSTNIDLSDFEELVPAIELLKEISAYQNIGIHQLYMKDVDFRFGSKTERVVTEMLRMPSFNDVRSVVVKHCDLTTMIWRQLSQQLPHLNKLEKLDLQNTTRTLAQEVVQTLVPNLRHCHQIATLKLSYNSLENCLATFPGSVFDIGLPNLEKLILKQTQLSRHDVQSVLQAIANNSFPKLKELNLSGNTLTDSVRHLVRNAGSGFSSLELLDLENTELDKSDLSALATLAQVGHLPKLRTLILSNNILTDDLSDLFGDSNHPRFRSLEELMLNDTQLSGEDFKTLSAAVKAGKLPHLKFISIFLNEDEVVDVKDKMDEFETTCENIYSTGQRMDITLCLGSFQGI